MGGHYTRGARRIAPHAIGQNPTSVRAHRPALRTHRGGDVAPTRSKPIGCRSHTRATRRPGATAPRPDESSDPDDSRPDARRNSRSLPTSCPEDQVRLTGAPRCGFHDSVAKIPLVRDAGNAARVLETMADENRTDAGAVAGRGTSDPALRPSGELLS